MISKFHKLNFKVSLILVFAVIFLFALSGCKDEKPDIIPVPEGLVLVLSANDSTPDVGDETEIRVSGNHQIDNLIDRIVWNLPGLDTPVTQTQTSLNMVSYKQSGIFDIGAQVYFRDGTVMEVKKEKYIVVGSGIASDWIPIEIPEPNGIFIDNHFEAGGKYYISMNGKVYRSADMENYTELPINVGQSRVVMLKQFDNRTFLGTDAGELYYTDNEGNSWTLVHELPTHADEFEMVNISDRLVLFMKNRWEDGYLFYSIDHGLSWVIDSSFQNWGIKGSEIFQCGGALLVNHFNYPRTFRTNDFIHYSMILNGRSIVALTEHDSIVYASIMIEEGFPQFFKSSDEGATWQFVKNSGFNEVYSYDGLLFGIRDKDKLFDAIYFSKDQGKTWTDFTDNLAPYETIDFKKLVFFNGYVLVTFMDVFQGKSGVWARKVSDLLNE